MLDALPGRLSDAGVSGEQARLITEAADANGVGAVARLDLGADTGLAMGAVSDAFLDGMRLCLTVSATLLVFAALASAVLLRRPRQATAPAAAAPAPQAAAQQ